MNYVPPPYVKLPPLEVRQQCLQLVLDAAERYGIPPAWVTAHIRAPRAVQARREVMLAMLDLGLTRSQVAMAFARDLRRVRGSVIGGPRSKKGRRRPLDYAKVDLFGQPLDGVRKVTPRATRGALEEAWALLATLLPNHPVAAAWRERYRPFGR